MNWRGRQREGMVVRVGRDLAYKERKGGFDGGEKFKIFTKLVTHLREMNLIYRGSMFS